MVDYALRSPINCQLFSCCWICPSGKISARAYGQLTGAALVNKDLRTYDILLVLTRTEENTSWNRHTHEATHLLNNHISQIRISTSITFCL